MPGRLLALVAAAQSVRRRLDLLGVALVTVALTASCAPAGHPAGGQPGRGNPGYTPLVAATDARSSPGSGVKSLARSSGSTIQTPPPFTSTSPAPPPTAATLPGSPPDVLGVPQPVPPNLSPPLSKARKDLPPIYFDGCHLAFTETRPPTCAFGDIASRTRVVLIGDSSAAQWFPALQRLAVAQHWRLESLTKSACTIADIAVWQSGLRRAYTECAAWRSSVLRRIRAERPDLVIASTSHGYRLMISGRPVPLIGHEATYQAALTRTLRTLKATSKGVVLLGMTPNSRVDPPVCLAANPGDARSCATPFDVAVDGPFRSLEVASSASAGARWVDPTAWVCPADPCPAIVGRILVYRDPGHLTATFAAWLRARLGSALPPVS